MISHDKSSKLLRKVPMITFLHQPLMLVVVPLVGCKYETQSSDDFVGCFIDFEKMEVSLSGGHHNGLRGFGIVEIHGNAKTCILSMLLRSI